jgi:exonuclease III
MSTCKKIMLTCKLQTTLINIYGPNSDCPKFYEKIRECFMEFDNDFFILCGDFNIALNQTLDTQNYCHVNNPKARDKLIEIMNDIHLVDYYRVLNPCNKIFTWRKKRLLSKHAWTTS